MTNSWITKEMEEEIKEKVQTITFGQSELSEEEIAEIQPKWLEHYEKHKNDNDVFETNGIAIIWFEVPEVPRRKDGKPDIKLYDNNDGTKRTNFLCKWKLGWVNIWASLDFWKPIIKQTGKKKVVRGKLKTQYDIKGTIGTGTYKAHDNKEYPKYPKKQYFKTFEEACEKTHMNREVLDEDDLLKSYTMNAWQILG